MVVLNAFACDICGGSSLGLDANVLSSQTGNSIGLNTSAKLYKADIEGDQQNIWLLNTSFNGSYQPHQKVLLKIVLPVFTQFGPDGSKARSGMGDLMILTNMYVLEKRTEKDIRHQMMMSAGIEFPSGTSNNDIADLNSIAFTSNSFDFVLGSSYALNIKKFILSGYVFSKVNTKGKDNYRFGSTIESALQGAFRFDIKDGQLFPSLGIKHYWQDKDVSNDFIRIFTGGQTLATFVGLQFNYYSHKIGVITEAPIYQELNNPDLRSGIYLNLQYTYQF